MQLPPYDSGETPTESPSSFTTYSIVPSVEPALGVQKAPCLGPSALLVSPAVQAVSWPLVESMLKLRMRSAPRSGAIRNLPVGSAVAECGCGRAWRSARGPVPDIVNFIFCRACPLPLSGSLNVDIDDGSLYNGILSENFLFKTFYFILILPVFFFFC